MPSSTWDLIHAERRQLIEDLDALNADQWATPSLCPEWTVHQMLGHLVALSKQTPPKFFAKFAGSGFTFNKMVAKDVAKETAGSPQQTLAELKRHLHDTTSPPGRWIPGSGRWWCTAPTSVGRWGWLTCPRSRPPPRSPTSTRTPICSLAAGSASTAYD
jgi:uncharacterized protein (TIGR03083 family)